MSTKRILTRFILGVAFLLAVTAAAEAQTPSGSVAFETAEASAMDTMWVGCTVVLNGKIYGCTVTGLSAPMTGIARVSGMVFDLKDPANFAGTYTAAGNDISLGGGHLVLKNQQGVRMVLSAFGDLVELRAADKGVVVTLKEERKRAG